MAPLRGDQASGLRRLLSRPAIRIVAFVAGRPDVGKTAAVANLAVALAHQGKEVLLVDENVADNIAAFFGIGVPCDLQEAIDGERPLNDVVVTVLPGVRLLSTALAVRQLARLSPGQQRTLLDSIGELAPPVDVVLVDASLDHPLGFSPLALAAHEAVVVAAPSGPAITEAYALIKKVSLGYARRHFRVLVNKARLAPEAQAIYDNIARLIGSRGLARVDYAGFLPLDERLRQASRLCQPVAALFPDSPAARAIQSLAEELTAWPMRGGEGSGLEHFVQQLLHFSQHVDSTAIYA